MTSPSVKLLRTQSDERLVELARLGHERAFEAIVERYRRALLRHCRRVLPEARAEDALQQALVSAWTALARGDEVRELRPWLYRIVRNTSLNALRASGYNFEQLVDSLQGAGGPAEVAERRAVVHQTLTGLAGLPERQREALLRIAVEGRPQGEVAEQLGLTEGAVRQLVHRARTSLRAAATAVTPLPLVTWLAGAGERGDLVARVGEIVAGGGAGATLAKAGTVAVLAGGAVGSPAVVDRLGHTPVREARAAAVASPRAETRRDAGRAARPDAAPAPATPVASLTPRRATPTARPERRRGDDGGSGGSRSGPGSRRGREREDDGARPSVPTTGRGRDEGDEDEEDERDSGDDAAPRRRDQGGDDEGTAAEPEHDADEADSSRSESGRSDEPDEAPEPAAATPFSSDEPHDAEDRDPEPDEPESSGPGSGSEN